jgi:hypothetical protein
MLRSGIGLFGLVGALAWINPASAQVFIKAPFVRVQTGGPGGGVYVKAPFVTVNVPPNYPVYYPPPGYSVPVAPAPVTDPALPELPQPQPIPPSKDDTVIIPPNPQPVVPTKVVAKKAVMTHYEFAKVFVPIAGKHEVTLIHAGNGKAVDVGFVLPPGVPKVRTGPRYITFDYGNARVEVRFALFGKVKVFYN